MPRLILTANFRKAVRKMAARDRDAAKRIEAALARFESDPRHPGLNFEKLSGSRHYSIRASRGERIVLLPAGDDAYEILDAGAHDAIYRRYG